MKPSAKLHSSSGQPFNRQVSAKEHQPARPRFEVQGQVPRKKISLDLKVTASQLIGDYAQFLSKQGGCPVTPEAIVERLVEELARDKAFKLYMASLALTEAPSPLSLKETSEVQT
jgi:hypothetical protein